MKNLITRLTVLLIGFAVAGGNLYSCKKDNGTDELRIYNITVTSGTNGTASADKTTAKAGETITLTAMADPGCEFAGWTVESGGTELSSLTEATATFTMPAANVSVKAGFFKGILINGIVWAPSNVDAPGTFAANPEDYGMYYQWNRRTGWSSTEPLTSSPSGATWDATDAAGDEWEAANDPCPAGWRVPTHEELVALCDDAKTTNEWTTLNDVYGCWFTDSENSVFLPASGGRVSATGLLSSVGSGGNYWSGTPSSVASARALGFDSGAVSPQNPIYRAYGFAVRCVAE